MMDLGEHHFLVRTFRGTPPPDLPLERAPLAVGMLPGMLFLNPAKQRDGLQRRLLLELLLDQWPDRFKRINAGPPQPRSRPLGRQFASLPILPCRLLVHTRLPGRKGQTFPGVHQPEQFSNLTILDHRNLLSDKRLRLC